MGNAIPGRCILVGCVLEDWNHGYPSMKDYGASTWCLDHKNKKDRWNQPAKVGLKVSKISQGKTSWRAKSNHISPQRTFPLFRQFREDRASVTLKQLNMLNDVWWLRSIRYIGERENLLTYEAKVANANPYRSRICCCRKYDGHHILFPCTCNCL